MNWRMMQIVQQKYTRMQNLLQYCRLTCLVGAVLVMCSLPLILSGCTSPFITPSQSGNGSVPTLTPITSPTLVGSATAQPNPVSITLQVASNCPSTVNWDKLVGTHVNVNKVQKVTCGNLLGDGTTQALVNVRSYSSDAKLDFYVYSNLSATPTQVFKMQGLLMGDAQISPTNTIITAEIGPQGLPTVVPNLFKEYQWSGGAFVQVLFPGIYPDMTHYQAEQAQATVNAGRNTGRTSGFPVVSALALHVFHWSQTSDKTLTFDSRHGIYLIQVSNQGPGGGGFIAKLFRLDNVVTNIFEIMQITPLDGSTALSLPLPGAKINNPAHVSGSTPASGNVLARFVVYDNSDIAIGDSGAVHGSLSGGIVNFTNTVSFQLNAHGVQEGVVAFFTTTQNNIDLSNQVVMSKVYLSY